jgi:hypothetical protein
MLDLVPTGHIALNDALMAYIRQQYGDEWTEPIVVFEDSDSGEIELRSGPPNLETGLGAQKFQAIYEEARRVFQTALAKGQLIGSVEEFGRGIYHVQREYWNTGIATRALSTGKYEPPGAPSSASSSPTIFFNQAHFEEWLGNFGRMTSRTKADASHASNLDEVKCRKWLTALMKRGTTPEKPKREFHEEANQKFGLIPKRMFDRAWANSIADSGNKRWSKPGRKS